MKFRKKPVVIEAALFDGELVGDPVQVGQGAEWRVQPRTCPEWFPAVVEELSDAPIGMDLARLANDFPANGVAGYDGALYILTLEGVMRADPGDWIIRGLKGEIYPCKPDIFEATYERV
jgi:hypothetical protein